MKGGVILFRGTGAAACRYLESDRSRADDYYLEGGTALAAFTVTDGSGEVPATSELNSAMVDIIPCNNMPDGVSSMFSVAETSMTPASRTNLAPDVPSIHPKALQGDVVLVFTPLPGRLGRHGDELRPVGSYDRLLLRVDWLHGDDTPACEPMPGVGLDHLQRRAEDAIQRLVEFGVDVLSVELLLADLVDASSLG